MRRSSTPYPVKRLYKIINQWYVKRFIAPQFDSLGSVPEIAHPRSLVIFGRNIHLGKYAQIICASDYCLISPGVRISAAKSIRIGDNCMFAANVTISDSDWHGIYNRIRPFRCTKSVVIENNVWLGERVIVNKGVTIGENSVVGAGSVVTKNIPANSVAAGNPARIIKTINPKRRMLKRELLFKNAEHYFYNQDQLDKFMLGNNGWLNWLRFLISPNRND
jgi:acetyltransferase-like isoleucine patch superfamily enzyme